MEIYKVEMRKKQELNLKSRNVKISDKEVQKESQNKQSGMKNKTLKGENVAEIFLFFCCCKIPPSNKFFFHTFGNKWKIFLHKFKRFSFVGL